ncbi:MAG: di-heme enzyme [Deltaproteobacteria bacterium]|nr:di-heme enzyme [Deltaproteobacteria bacterium]
MRDLHRDVNGRRALTVALAIGALAACGGDSTEPPPTTTTSGGGTTFDFGLPPGVPKPRVPADNPMTPEKVELGRHLFHDTRLSLNETQSCASCHLQGKAFTDGRATSVGSTGDATPRGSMSLANVGYLTTLTWANPVLVALEDQALVPMFGEDPVELGLSGNEQTLLDRLAADPRYATLFAAAYPDEAEPFSLASVVRAIASFERTILSFSSPYDRYAYGGDPDALDASAKRGRDLFFSEELECFHCHGGFNFSDSTAHDGTAIIETMFHNTGLYNVGGTGAYPEPNTGVFAITGLASDMGRFRAPTLRNVALTAPYMHDGSMATLDEVLDHYAAGGRNVASGPNAGDGRLNPNKSEFLHGFALTQTQRADVIAFLESLTDTDLTERKRLSDPWTTP